MASETKEPATNQRIVQLLEDVRAQLADTAERQERMARDLRRLLDRA